MGLVWARGSAGTVNDVQLTVLPATDTEKETEQVRLLFGMNGLDVFVSTHLEELE